ncbi:hypothetical protein FA13DRAFT_1800623 [Coprinellus micaceus]|uniref:Uncharacterized protein n=1 Tax=Coprinellus micaceus TaxID=71717 RepID=A0A4Y7SGD4_COPMI|nr:hypothetical protein FA13DRAFT_1800623 [Coprinellus micaceus]
MTAYSAFFSSGLLAPRSSLDIFPNTPSKGRSPTSGFPTPYGDSSPIRPVSPLPPTQSEPDEMDIESSSVFARESTPTQHSVSAALAQHHRSTSTVSISSTTSNASNSGNGSGSQAQPRTLRKRRSSLTLGTSPLTAIRSPTRNVGAALQLQRHLGSRSRSGSVTGPIDDTFPVHNVHGIGMGVATEATSLMGRLRSGSVGSSLHYNGSPPVRGTRRHVRRTTSVPAPVPPPSAPLPALPPLPPLPMGAGAFQKSAGAVSRTPFSFQNKDVPGSAGVPTSIKGRARGLSIASVARIEEDVKEN